MAIRFDVVVVATLGQPLLLGPRVRAMATRDLERIYAADPGFSIVPEVEAALAE